MLTYLPHAKGRPCDVSAVISVIWVKVSLIQGFMMKTTLFVVITIAAISDNIVLVVNASPAAKEGEELTVDERSKN